MAPTIAECDKCEWKKKGANMETWNKNKIYNRFEPTTLNPKNLVIAVAVFPGESADTLPIDPNYILEGNDMVTHFPIEKDFECITCTRDSDNPMNRAMFSQDGKSITQIIWGPMYILKKDADGKFIDIDMESAKTYVEMFEYPHFFVGSEEGLSVYSKRDETTYVLEAVVRRNKKKRKKG